MKLGDFTFLLPTPRGYPALIRGKESYVKGPPLEAARLTSFPSYLDLQNSWSDPKVQKASGYLQLNENFKQVAPGLPQSITGAWLIPPKNPSKSI